MALKQSENASGARGERGRQRFYHEDMAFPIKVCSECGEEFELKPDKPGFANRCPACSEPESDGSGTKAGTEGAAFKNDSEANAERRRVMRDMLYRKDS
ncbi:MAG TPA: hypothetical protein VME68_18845 [Acidobacteriaceae bacterium]|nr:hypothetical protein [Acidobacteriaceae bacterium]